MATGKILNNLAADVNALKSNKVDMLKVSGSGGYNSATSMAALRNAVDALPSGAVRLGTLSAGDIGLILALNAGATTAVVFYFRYNTAITGKGLVLSMSKTYGTWGDWVNISP